MSRHTLIPNISRNKAALRIQFSRTLIILMILAFLYSLFLVGVNRASADDAIIPGYLAQVSLENLNTVVNKLVTDYGPRYSSFYQPYVDDICTVSTAAPYPKNNYMMAADYVASLFSGMGYVVERETISLNGGYTGDNIIVKKTGSLYPNDYIEVGGHLDSQPTTPGAGDNASGSTAIVEMARVLKDYPSKYSIRFLLFVGHEHGGNTGSMYHLSQVQARGEVIKAALTIDSIGWSDLDPLCVDGYGSCTGLHSTDLWLQSTDEATMHIANVFAAAATDFNIPSYIDIDPAGHTWSENTSYASYGWPVVLSVGGTPYAAPGYHGASADGGCHDTLGKLNRQNIFLSTQVNIAALLRLDDELPPPAPTFPAAAAVASSVEYNANPLTKRPMNIFDGNPNSYWTMENGNWGYADRWIQADLGVIKSISGVTLKWGVWGTSAHNDEALPKDFQLWIGNDPTFQPGSYTVAASVTDLSDPEDDGAATLTFTSPVEGRWIRYIVTRVTGTIYYDWALGEMEITSTDVEPIDTKLTVAGATAKSDDGTHLPSLAFDGHFDTYWNINSTDTIGPWWVQADLGSSVAINRVLVNYSGGYGRVEDGTKGKDFQIWIGDDPNFGTGNYTVAATIGGNDSWYRWVDFGTVTGRYLRYVVSATKGTALYAPSMMFELEVWQTDQSLVTISGNVGAPGVNLSYFNVTNRTVMSDLNGAYSITVPSDWSGTVTPSRSYFTFDPTIRTYSNVTANQSAQDYTATSSDPIFNLVNQVSPAQMTDVVKHLTEDYGPRAINYFQVYTDNQCTPGVTTYEVSNEERAAIYAKGVFDAMGDSGGLDYTAVLETVPGQGYNVVVTKIGTAYPNDFIEFGGHLDSRIGTPGANDNASGSAAVIELARVLKDYPTRYSITFGLWAGEEFGGSAGAHYHVDQMLAAGKHIKAGLNLDNMGQLALSGIYRDDVWTNTNPETIRIWSILNQVNTNYGIGLQMVNNADVSGSDQAVYWNHGLPAVTNVGG